MNRYMNKAAAVLALLAVFLCAGCNGNAEQTTTTAALSLIADDDTSEDEILLDDSEEFDVEYGELGDFEVEEFGEVIEDVSGIDMESGETETDEDEQRPDTGAELITELQTSGQLIHADDYCQIRYFGEMKADNGEAVIVLGYSKFHGGLVRILNNGFRCGDIVDGGALWFSPMNTFTDGYWCHSGAHGWEFYDDPSEQWWTDNEFICLRCPSGGTEVDTEEKAGYAEYAAVQGKFMMYDDSVYDGVSKLGLYLTDLRIQEAVEGNFETKEPPYFAEPSNENVHVCTSEYYTQVIRVRFDPDKADLWAHT